MTIWLENKNKKTAHPGLRTYRCSPVCIYRVQGGCGNTVHGHILHLQLFQTALPTAKCNQPSHATASSSIAKINAYFQVTGTWMQTGQQSSQSFAFSQPTFSSSSACPRLYSFTYCWHRSNCSFLLLKYLLFLVGHPS